MDGWMRKAEERLNDMKSAKEGLFWARCTRLSSRFQRLKRQAAATSCTAFGQLPWLRRTGRLPSRMDCHQLQPRRASGIKSVLGSQLPCRYLLQSKLTIANPMHIAPVGRRSAFKRCQKQSSKDKMPFKWREGREASAIKAHQGPNCCCLGLAAFVEAWRAFSP